MKKLYIVITLCMLMIAIESCTNNSSPESNGPRLQKELILPVEVQTIQQIDWVNDVTTYGSVKKPDLIDIIPKMPGKLVRLLVTEGQSVKKDDVVAIVDRDEIGLSYKPVEVKSTVAGKVETLYLKEGASVSDADPILSISKQEDLKLIVEIFETDLVKVRNGLKVIITLDALPKREFTGRVNLIKSYLDAASGKGEVEITFDRNNSEILSGMFGRASIIINKKSVLAVTPDAIKKINGNRAVYIVKDGIAKLTLVELGLQKADAVEIKDGISTGDTVITFATDELKDGTRVKIIEGNRE